MQAGRSTFQKLDPAEPEGLEAAERGLHDSVGPPGCGCGVNVRVGRKKPAKSWLLGSVDPPACGYGVNVTLWGNLCLPIFDKFECQICYTCETLSKM